MIKNLLVAFVLIFSFTTTSVFAQEQMPADAPMVENTSYKKMNVRLNPGSLLGSLLAGGFGISAGFDYAYSPQWTVGLVADYGSFNLTSTLPGLGELLPKVEGSGFGVGARLQFFTRKVYTNSWYFAPEFVVSSQNLTTSFSQEVSFLTYNLSLKAGYMWIWSSGFNIQLGIGPGYRIGSDLDLTMPDSTAENFADSRFTILGDISIGFNF